MAGSALRQHSVTGVPQKAHARLVPGPATLVIRVDGRQGLPVSVAEAAFEVK